MLRVWAALLAVSMLGCSGIWFGDSGNSEVDPPTCAQQQVRVDNLLQPPSGFERAPADLLTPATGVLEGTLELPDGDQVPLTIEITAEPELIRAVYSGDPQAPGCPQPWLLATVTLAIDAGATLTGTTRGELYLQSSTQIRGERSPLADFETTLRPVFDREIVHGPTVMATLWLDADGVWRGNLEFVALVAMTPCQPREMCAGAAGSPPEFRPIGAVVVRKRSMP